MADVSPATSARCSSVCQTLARACDGGAACLRGVVTGASAGLVTRAARAAPMVQTQRILSRHHVCLRRYQVRKTIFERVYCTFVLHRQMERSTARRRCVFRSSISLTRALRSCRRGCRKERKRLCLKRPVGTHPTSAPHLNTYAELFFC